MANTQDIRRRIKSIRNTAQITKAMQMVAASKMRKAQQHALAGRPYASLMNRVLVSLQQRTDPKMHPLLQVREVKKELVIVISTDKGLAGALNTNLFREVANFEAEKSVYLVVGRKARQFLSRTRREILADFELKDAPSFPETKVIAQFATEKFLSGEVDRVSVLYTHFVNTINQKPTVRTLLPISNFEVAQAEAAADGQCDRERSDGRISFRALRGRRARRDAAVLSAVSGFPNDPRRARFRAQRAHGGDEKRDR